MAVSPLLFLFLEPVFWRYEALVPVVVVHQRLCECVQPLDPLVCSFEPYLDSARFQADAVGQPFDRGPVGVFRLRYSDPYTAGPRLSQGPVQSLLALTLGLEPLSALDLFERGYQCVSVDRQQIYCSRGAEPSQELPRPGPRHGEQVLDVSPRYRLPVQRSQLCDRVGNGQ